MAHYRRILKAIWRTGVFSIALVVVVLATSVMVNLPPPVFAADGGSILTVESVRDRPHEPNPPDPRVTARAMPDHDLDILSEDGKASLHIPEGAVEQESEIELVQHGSSGAEAKGMLNVIELNAFKVHWGTVMTSSKVKQFNQQMTITIKHDPEELQGLDADTLKLYYLNEEDGEWIPVADSCFDPETNTLTATTDHFSYYGENANPTILGPGMVMAYLADLHSGATTTAYSIEVPPGSGGFQPSISLSYNSASVDEMKNKRSVGSWVGVGWSLGLGCISYDVVSGRYLLSLDGAICSELVQDAGGAYHTNSESFYKITRSGQQWDVYDREGVHYRFGGTADSEQYYDNSIYYRWDLSSIQDSNPGNAVTVTYVQDNWTDGSGKTHVRSAYPSHVLYNNGHVDVQFNSSYDINPPGYGPLRMDNPQDPAPKVVENRRLNSIEARVDGNLARKYVFTYNTTDDEYSDDYGGIYYSGRHTLTSITEYGSDGVSALPSTCLTYANLEIYHNDDDEVTYSGNPGNPTSLTWPYLATVANGYGAVTTYSYAQKPSTTAVHIWTREVVTTKTIDSGVGPAEAYQYTYTENPQYLHVGPGSHAWNDQYRGFSEVRINDAAGNYTRHYFWTTGTEDARILTGNEYKTEWYDSGAQLLKREEFTWDYRNLDIQPPLSLTAVVPDCGYQDQTLSVTITGTNLTAATSVSFGPGVTVNGFSLDSDSQITAGVTVGVAAVSGWRDVSVTTATGSAVQADGFWVIGTAAVSSDGWRWQNPQSQGGGLSGVWGSSSSNVFAVGSGGVILHYNASAWSAMISGSMHSLRAVWGSSPSNVFAVGDVGTILHYNGTNWSPMSSGTWYALRGVWGSSSSEVFAVGDGGATLRYNGSAWSTMNSGTMTPLYGVWGSSGSDVFAVGFSGTIRHYNGSTWGSMSSGTWFALRSVWGSSVSDVFAVGHYGVIRHYNGSAWSGMTSGTTNQLNGVWGSSCSDVFAEGQYGTILHYIEYAPPAISGVNPCRGGQGSTFNVVITGVDFTAATVVSFGEGITVNGFTVDSATQISANITISGSAGVGARDVSVTTQGKTVTKTGGFRIDRISVPFIYLKQVTDTIGSKTARIRYEYDDYGNVIKEYHDGDTATSDDDSTVERHFYPNVSANILGCVAAENVTDALGNAKQQTLHYYDGNNECVSMPPAIGNITRIQEHRDATSTVSRYFTYDTWGNQITETDARSHQWQTIYDGTYHTFPATLMSPIVGTESYAYDERIGELLSVTDVNSAITTYEYDAFGRLSAVIKPGDSSLYPTTKYERNNWGMLNQQHQKSLVRTAGSDYLWTSEYYDGLGRVVQTHSRGETGRTVVESTVVYNNRGLVEKEYVSQDLSSLAGYTVPMPDWKYASYQYDGLGRVISTTATDGTVTSIDYSAPWQETVTNARGYKHRYSYDAFGQLATVEELDASDAVYATTSYQYDVLGNLTEIGDAHGNVTTMTYDWLARRTTMTHPDMGHSSYEYDGNGNPTSQTDAENQTITFAYDALDRLTDKNYAAGSGMTDVVYAFDSTSGGNYGKGLLTGVSDNSGTTVYRYDARGRLIQEKRTIEGADYVTQYGYDSADRLAEITYPTGEVVEQSYDGRGLPATLTGTVAGDLVTETLYNQLGGIRRINLGNGATTIYAYYGLDAGAPSGYYGRLWQIETSTSSEVLQDMRYAWDANGNLTERQDLVSGETEDFTYDFLDRLTSVSGAYTESYAYDEIGNITSRNGAAYTYGNQPHAVTAAGGIEYAYDANGNMTSGRSQYDFDPDGRPSEITSPVSIWERRLGATYYPWTESGQQTSDNCFILAGHCRMTSNDDDAFWLMKTDGDARLLWEKTFDTNGARHDRAQSVQQTSDGGYIMVGYTYIDGGYHYDVWLVKADSNGEKQWDRTFGGDGDDRAYSVRQTSDGGYIIAGETSSYGSGDSDVWLIKTDSSGDKLWGKTFDKYDGDWANSVRQTSDGGYIIAGATYSAAEYHADAWLIKTDSSGRTEWDKIFGGYAGWKEGLGCVEQTSDGGYVVGGGCSATTGAEHYAMLVKMASDGNVQWGRMFNGPSGVFSVRQTPDAGYVAVGPIEIGDSLEGFILKLDHAGNSEWCKVGFEKGYQPVAVDLTSDGGYALFGLASYGHAAWLAKVNISQNAFFYDAFGNSTVRTENGETTVRVNKYYEKNLTTGEETSHYYLGNWEVAYRKGSGAESVEYVHQDHLGSTVLTSDSSGTEAARISYYPFGLTRSSSGVLETDMLFTGQRLVDSGLYNYNARYYDANIGRFVSPDTIVQDYGDPQSLNSYSYCRNNPLKYVDPSGHSIVLVLVAFFVGALIGAAGYTASVVIDNAIHHQPLLDNWEPVDCATWAAVGGLSGAVLSGGALVTAMGSKFAASMLVNTLGAEAGYGISAGRKGEWRPEGAAWTGVTAAGFTVAGFGVGKAGSVVLDRLGGGVDAGVPQVGDKVYRAFGADARGYGRSWVRTNPLTVKEYANVAGLPSEKGLFGYAGGSYNSGGFIAEGTILSTDGLKLRSALSLHGRMGGIEELVFRDPVNQIRIDRVYGVNPWLNP